MKKKLNLTDLKVQSFVTNIENNQAKTLVGGSGPIVSPTYHEAGCQTLNVNCATRAAGQGC